MGTWQLLFDLMRCTFPCHLYHYISVNVCSLAFFFIICIIVIPFSYCQSSVRSVSVKSETVLQYIDSLFVLELVNLGNFKFE